MGDLPKAGVLTVRLVQIPRSILGEGFELKDYKTPRDVTVGEKETVAFDSSNVEKNESLKGTRNSQGSDINNWLPLNLCNFDPTLIQSHPIQRSSYRTSFFTCTPRNTGPY